MLTKRLKFFEGVKVGLPVALGYIPIAVAFGILSKSLDIPLYISVLMSLLIYAGASQFIGVNLLVLGASFGEIVITTFLLNLRHFLMTATLSQRLNGKVSKNGEHYYPLVLQMKLLPFVCCKKKMNYLSISF